MEKLELINVQQYQAAKHEIKEKLNSIADDFVYIGYRLKQIQETGLYQEDGYADIFEFGQKEYSLSKSSVSRFMAINDKYSIDGNSPELAEQYKGYGSSKLSEMLTLPEEDMVLVPPDTKREDIRELKRFNQEEKQQEKESVVKSMDIGVLLVNLFKDVFQKKKEEFNRLCKMYAKEQPGQETLEEFVFCLNPSGNFTQRVGIVYISFQSLENGIVYKQFSSTEIKRLTYEQAEELFLDTFGEYIKMKTKNYWNRAFGTGEEEPPAVEKKEPVAPAQQESKTVENTKAESVKEPVMNEPEMELEVPEKVEEKEELPAPEKKVEKVEPEIIPEPEEVVQLPEKQIEGQKHVEDYPEVLPEDYEAQADPPAPEKKTRYQFIMESSLEELSKYFSRKFKCPPGMQDCNMDHSDCAGCYRKWLEEMEDVT